MAIKFSKTSIQRMDGLHPDIVRVLYAAAALATDEEDFMVLEGVRSKEKMWETYGKGRTAAELAKKGVPAHYARPAEKKVTWLNNPLASNHRKMADGYGHGVDLAVWPIDFNATKRYVALYHLIMKAAKQEGVRLRSGFDWDQDGIIGEKGETDLGHYELV